MKPHAKILTKTGEIASGGLISYICHAHMDCLDRELWFYYSAAFRQQFEQQQRILAARQSDKDMVAILYHAEATHSLLKGFRQTLLYFHHFINTRYTAQIIRKKANIWFQCKFCP